MHFFIDTDQQLVTVTDNSAWYERKNLKGYILHRPPTSMFDTFGCELLAISPLGNQALFFSICYPLGKLHCMLHCTIIIFTVGEKLRESFSYSYIVVSTWQRAMITL